MRKRSKRRIPQDIKPWERVQESSDSEDDSFAFSTNMTTHWEAGTRRKRETTVLNRQIAAEQSKLLLKSFMFDQVPHSGNSNHEILRRSQLQYKLSKLHRMAATYRSKNSCYFVGRGRTFNRDLFVARHTLRKLARFGLISGLKKS